MPQTAIAGQIPAVKHLFSPAALRALLIPLMIEQLLNGLMGIADTMMVTTVGPVAISAVSLVDSINMLVIFFFAAIATGGTIVCSQYIGREEPGQASLAGRQLVLAALVVSVAVSVLFIFLRGTLLRLVFGSVEAAVMQDAETYFFITALSYPFIALYNASAALYRTTGNSRLPMRISAVSNGMNIAGNTFLIFGLHMGVAGAALSTLVCRIFCAVVVLASLRRPGQTIVIDNYRSIRPDFAIIGLVLTVGIPSGVENSIFQLGKLLVQSTISTMGTEVMEAMAMANMLQLISGMAAGGIGLGLITVAGQCMGARRPEEARYYMIRLPLIGEAVLIATNLLLTALLPLIVSLAGMEAESAALTVHMAHLIFLVEPLIWVPAFILPNGLRAAGDVRFTMMVSITSMWIFRLGLTNLLVFGFGFGCMAVWVGMFTDWTVRALLFVGRFIRGRWSKKQVLKEDAPA